MRTWKQHKYILVTIPLFLLENPRRDIFYDIRIYCRRRIIVTDRVCFACGHKQMIEAGIEFKFCIWVAGEKRFPCVEILFRRYLKVCSALQKEHGDIEGLRDYGCINPVQGMPIIFRPTDTILSV